MPLLRATPNHLPAINQLLQNAYYRYVDMGMEDLPGLLANGSVALGQEQSQGKHGAFSAYKMEDRPLTMPNHAPTRGHLRAVAFQHNHPPEIELRPFDGADCARENASPILCNIFVMGLNIGFRRH